MRSVASATRLRGPLDLNALSQSLTQVVARHGALRTRIVVCNGEPAQLVHEARRCELDVEDLTNVSDDLLQQEVPNRIEAFIRQPIDVAADALFGMRVLKLRDDEHVLIIAMEHMISDAYSMSIVSRELFSTYREVRQGQALSLPPKPLQFADYAADQRRTARLWIEKHGKYWTQRLQGCGRLRFPDESSLLASYQSGWGVTPIQIGNDLTQRLRSWSRNNRTTLPMVVFAAYVALVLRWCGVSESVIRYQGNGRAAPGAENSVGFYASRLYLRVALRPGDRFIDLARRLMAEWCKAYGHDDFSYLETQDPPPECAQNPFFNWIPKERGLSAWGSPEPFANPWLQQLEWDNEPMVLLYEGDSEITGCVRYPRSRFTAAIMKRFRDNFLRVLESLVTEPAAAAHDVVSVI